MDWAQSLIGEALERALGNVKGDEGVVPGKVPVSPWALWLLFALVRHEERQRWVGEVVVGRLGGSLEALNWRGSSGHPGIAQSGLVPGLTEWNYYFHGRGCQLTHRGTGECLEVDFYLGSARYIDLFFYRGYLKSLKKPEFLEKRLMVLHPNLKVLNIAARELLELGLLVKQGNAVGLAEGCGQWLEGVNRINALCAQEQECRRVGLALGDSLLAKESGETGESVDRAVASCVDARRLRLTRALEDQDTRPEAIEALVELDGNNAREVLEKALLDGDPGTVATALNTLGQQTHEDWTKQVSMVLERVNPNGLFPWPGVWILGAQYILERNGDHAAVRKALGEMRTRELGDAAILALERAPEHALLLFRRALRSSVPNDRCIAAAALAILDQAWSRRELVSALKESSDETKTRECRSALMALANPGMHAIVEEWEKHNQRPQEAGATVTINDMALRLGDSWMQFRIQKLHDRVIVLRPKASDLLDGKKGSFRGGLWESIRRMLFGGKGQGRN